MEEVIDMLLSQHWAQSIPLVPSPFHFSLSLSLSLSFTDSKAKAIIFFVLFWVRKFQFGTDFQVQLLVRFGSEHDQAVQPTKQNKIVNPAFQSVFLHFRLPSFWFESIGEEDSVKTWTLLGL